MDSYRQPNVFLFKSTHAPGSARFFEKGDHKLMQKWATKCPKTKILPLLN